MEELERKWNQLCGWREGKRKKKKLNHKLWAARDRPWVEFTGGEDNRSPLTNQDGKHLKL